MRSVLLQTRKRRLDRRRVSAVPERLDTGDLLPLERWIDLQELERQQIARVQALRGGRDSTAVERRLAALKDAAAQEDRNLMPLIVDASRDYVTMGEMCDALREVWGVWRETPVF